MGIIICLFIFFSGCITARWQLYLQSDPGGMLRVSSCHLHAALFEEVELTRTRYCHYRTKREEMIFVWDQYYIDYIQL